MVRLFVVAAERIKEWEMGKGGDKGRVFSPNVLPSSKKKKRIWHFG